MSLNELGWVSGMMMVGLMVSLACSLPAISLKPTEGLLMRMLSLSLAKAED